MNLLSLVLAPIKKIHQVACCYEIPLLLVTLLLLLRLPNLAEPYWYGDEAIYLTIGVALRNGAHLYQQIVDHKTPLIYFLAMVPNQFWFRMLLIGWMTATSLLFWQVSKKLLQPTLALIASVVFVIVTSWPGLEGNIPNGELFVMGFVLASFWLLTQTTLFDIWHMSWERLTRKSFVWTKNDQKLLFAAGILSSLGILTKVPALLDAGALGSLFLFLAIAVHHKFPLHKERKIFLWFLSGGLLFIAGIATPILLSLVYFWLRGSLHDYIQFGLLYNIYYSGNWTLPFTQPWLLSAFSLPGKALKLVLFFLLSAALTFWKPSQRTSLWVSFWVIAALFASILSNRPYPHYLLQVVPPLCLAFFLLFQRTTHWMSRILLIDTFVVFALVVVLLNFGMYETLSYYRRYWQFALGQISPAEYRASFNSLVPQNEELVTIIDEYSQAGDPIFVWGTNPMLYAQAQRPPATRFTVAFHIHDLKVYEQTLTEIKDKKPKFIVIMKGESDFDKLNSYLREYYIVSKETADMRLYRRTSLSSLYLLQ